MTEFGPIPYHFTKETLKSLFPPPPKKTEVSFVS